MDIAELSRRVESLIRIGTVAEIDHANACIRVESGGLVTDWLPWFEHRAGTTRTWDPPTVGEQVMVLSPSGETGAGICIVGINRSAHPAPSASASLHLTEYPDGAKVSYDHASGALEVTGIQTALVDAADTVTINSGTQVIVNAADAIKLTAGTLVEIDAPLTHVTQQLVVDGLLTYNAGLAGSPGGAGSHITGELVQTGGQLSSNGVVLDSHVHSGVQTGPSNTGGPQ